MRTPRDRRVVLKLEIVLKVVTSRVAGSAVTGPTRHKRLRDIQLRRVALALDVLIGAVELEMSLVDNPRAQDRGVHNLRTLLDGGLSVAVTRESNVADRKIRQFESAYASHQVIVIQIAVAEAQRVVGAQLVICLLYTSD